MYVTARGAHGFLQQHGGSGGDFNTTNGMSFQFYEVSNAVYYDIANGAGSFVTTNTGTLPPLNAWTHMVISNDGSRTSIFMNGTRIIHATTGFEDLHNATTSNKIQLGYLAGSNYQTDGYFTGLQYHNTEVYDASSTTITVPTAPKSADANTLLLSNFSTAGIIDHTMKNNLESRANTRITGQQVKFGTGSIYFDGTGDDLRNQEVDNPLFLMGTSDWTIECFAYSTGNQGSDVFGATLVYIGGAGSNNAIWLTQNSSDKLCGRILYNGSSWTLQLTSTASISHNTWYHVAFELYNGTAKVFINGTSEASGSFTADLNSTYGGRLSIGSRNATDRFFNGYLDEVRISRVGRYQGTNFTAPTQAFANR